MTEKVLLAVDAGGTKTEYCVKSLRDGSMRSYVFGGSNYKSVGLEKTRASLVEGFISICNRENFSPSQVQGAVFGLSGCDTEQDMLIYKEMIKDIGLNDEVVGLYNDCELAFLAMADAPGLCIVAGTGSNCMAFQVGKPFIRAGGWGALLSDGGSGFWISQQILKDMLLHYDGSGPGREVYANIARHFGIKKSEDIQTRFTALGISEIASVARVIIDYAQEGDEYTCKIISLAQEQLWDLITTLIRRMGYSTDQTLSIVLNGGLFGNPWFLESFWQGLSLRVDNPLQRYLSATNTSDNAMRAAQKLFGNM